MLNHRDQHTPDRNHEWLSFFVRQLTEILGLCQGEDLVLLGEGLLHYYSKREVRDQ